jgi:hypothetical protein
MRARAFFGEVRRQKMRHDKEESRFHESGSGSKHFSVRWIRLTAKNAARQRREPIPRKVEAALEHFSVSRIRLTVKKCGTTKKRADSTKSGSGSTTPRTSTA